MKEDAEKDKGGDPKLWGVILFGLIGATVTTFAVSSPHSFLLFNLVCNFMIVVVVMDIDR